MPIDNVDPDGNAGFVDDVNSDEERRRFEELETRRQWVTASIFALGFYAVLAVLIVFLCNRWNDLTSTLRTVYVCGILALNYAVAFVGAIKKNSALGRLFFFFGTLLFVVALVFLDSSAPTNFQNADWSWNFFDATASIAGYWALGTFVLAFAYESRMLHVMAILTILVWLGSDPGKIVAPVALLYCALGQHWAWRQSSPGFSYTYLALALVVVATSFAIPGMRVGAALIVPLVVLGADVVYWFGVNSKHPLFRGTALVAAAFALGLGSFDAYWVATIPFSDELNESVQSLTVSSLSNVFSWIFVIFCMNVMLTGARYGIPRFIFGALMLAVWIVVLSCHKGSGLLGLASIAIGVFLFLSIDFYLRKRRMRCENPDQIKPRTTDTDALTDDEQFDDPLDKEARDSLNTPHVLAIMEWFEEVCGKFAVRFGILALWFAVLLQFALIVFVAKKG